MKSPILLIILLLIGAVLIQRSFRRSSMLSVYQRTNIAKTVKIMEMKILSSAFAHQRSIPVKYTCDGEKINPPLEITGVPENAKSLALIMDDPDVPKDLRPDGMYVHWILWNIDPKTESITEHSVPAGAVEGVTTAGNPGYRGPCPPDREHRYFFKLYALDTILVMDSSADKVALENAMQGHIVAQAELVGVYDRKR